MTSTRSLGAAALFSSAVLFSACDGGDDAVGNGQAGSSAGGAGGVAGASWVSPCHCTGDAFSVACTTNVESFCGTESACTNALESARRELSTWLDADYPPVYQECDDGSARMHVAWGFENDERRVFDRASGALLYARADGYVSGLCGRGGVSLCWDPATGVVTEAVMSTTPIKTCNGSFLDDLTVTAGSAPADATCRGCRVRSANFDSSEGGAGGQGGAKDEDSNLPFCVVDASGQIALPGEAQ